MYCEYCGKSLSENDVCTCLKSKHGRKLSKKLIWGGIIAVSITLALITMFSAKMEIVDLAEYINIQAKPSGLNGKAVLELSELFNGSELENYLIESLGDEDEEAIEAMAEDEFETLLSGYGEGILECEKALEDIELTVWKNGKEAIELINLSNGDIVKVQVASQNPENKYLGKKFKTATVEFKVEDLLEGRELDVFADVNLEASFIGTDGNGQVQLSWNKNILPELSIEFHVENGTACCNGDEIKVVLDYNREKWGNLGYFPSEESKTYVVAGLSQILKTVEELPKEQLEKMRTNVEASIINQVENEWRDGTYLEGMRYLGSYLLSKKDLTMGLGSPNILYLIYEVDAFENYAPAGGEDSHLRYYYCCSYENLLFDEYGNIDMDTAYFSECCDEFIRNVCMGSSVLLNSVIVNYDGFETLEELVHECVNNYLDQYSYTTTVEGISE